MSESESHDDLDGRFADLRERANELARVGQYRSELAVCRELRRLAKSEGRLLPYLDACFHLMNHAGGRLEPEVGAEVAIELIALLENEDHARKIQPDLPEGPYSHAQAWMTACAYDNLALATGRMRGFNSEGLHACINEGIQVCRRTGKLQCITCFREYATHVYIAADDLDLARHFARMGELHQDPGPHDRRWVGVRDQALLDLYQGDLEGALEAGFRAWRMSDSYHTPLSARRESRTLVASILLMMGRGAEIESLVPLSETQYAAAPLAPGENPEDEYLQARNEALRLCIEGTPEAALPILDRYARLFEQRKYLHEWFDAKLRTIAALRLAGRDDAIKPQAEALDTRARAARDWFTLRRLARLLDPAVRPTPLALLGDVRVGPYAVASDAPDALIESAAPSAEPESQEEEPALTPMQERVSGFFARLRNAEDFEAESAAVQAEVLAVEPSGLAANEAAALLYLVRMMASPASDLPALWAWAKRAAGPHPKVANLVNQVAAFGGKLVTELDVPAEGDLDPQEIAAAFRRSLDLDPNDDGNHARAGSFFLAIGDASEAERCLARAFRLDRTSGYVATKLSSVYSDSGRSRDALAVLDLCLREGSDDPDVSWQAVLLSGNLEQWETLLSYASHFEANRPDRPWVNYYRATALVELGRGADALAAAEEELRRNPEAPFGPTVLSACAVALEGRTDEFRERLTAILDAPLSRVTYLTRHGLARLHELLWKAAGTLDEDDPSRRRLVSRLLATGLAPDTLFEELRKAVEPIDGVNFYFVVARQPLSKDWASSHACLSGEEDWTAYVIPWGVLARSEDEARESALRWQSRCASEPAQILDVEMRGEGYRDAPGVVWQGRREEASESS